MHEKAAFYSKEIDRMTRETFQRINCNDLYSLINQNKKGDPIFVYFGSVESLGTDFKHLQSVAVFERFSFRKDHQITFLVNTEIQCRRDNGFSKDPNDAAMALYLQTDQPAVRLMQSKHDVSSF